MSLRRYVEVASIIVLGSLCVLGGLLTATYYRAMATATADRAALVRFANVATTLNAIAAERGPTNAAMTTRVVTMQAMTALADGRLRSDVALAALAQDSTIAARSASVAAALAQARRAADHVILKPFEARSPSDIQTTIQGMFDVVDGGQALSDAAMQPIEGGKATTLLAFAQTIRMLSALRDVTGRMGSALIVPLATGTPMSDGQRSSYDLAHGRALMLADLLKTVVPLAAGGTLSADFNAAWARFSGEGMDLFGMELAGSRDGRYPMGAADFTAHIIPCFHGLDVVRDRFFQVARQSLEADYQGARSTFLLVSFATLLMVVLECVLLAAMQKLIFRPLMLALQTVQGMAKGTAEPLPDMAEGWGEVREMIGALGLLASRLRERDALDQQNVRLAARLRRLAERDGLTGILNRGALERVVASMTEAKAGPATIGLILFDIDHFKAINDTFGHGIGDSVLKITADRLRAVVDAGATFARFGGEEFAVVLPDWSFAAMRALAERLRQEIAIPIVLPTGVTIPITASFGLATAPCDAQAWLQLVDSADAALYRAKNAGRNMVLGGDIGEMDMPRRSAAA